MRVPPIPYKETTENLQEGAPLGLYENHSL